MSTQRVALVTGGMGGLGEAICIKLAALGDRVVTTGAWWMAGGPSPPGSVETWMCACVTFSMPCTLS